MKEEKEKGKFLSTNGLYQQLYRNSPNGSTAEKFVTRSEYVGKKKAKYRQARVCMYVYVRASRKKTRSSGRFRHFAGTLLRSQCACCGGLERRGSPGPPIHTAPAMSGSTRCFHRSSGHPHEHLPTLQSAPRPNTPTTRSTFRGEYHCRWLRQQLHQNRVSRRCNSLVHHWARRCGGRSQRHCQCQTSECSSLLHSTGS